MKIETIFWKDALKFSEDLGILRRDKPFKGNDDRNDFHQKQKSLKLECSLAHWYLNSCGIVNLKRYETWSNMKKLMNYLKFLNNNGTE